VATTITISTIVLIAIAGVALLAGFVVAWFWRAAQLASQHRAALSAMAETERELQTQLRLAEERSSVLSDQLSSLQERQQTLQQELQTACQQRDVAVTRTEEIPLLRQQLQARDERIERLLAESRQTQADLAAVRTELEQSRQAAEEKLRLLHEAREQLTREFEVLAQRIFEEKSQRLTQQNQTQLEATLTPLRQQLGDFRKRIDDVYDNEARDRASLRSELAHLKELNQRMSQEALNLTRALKGDNKLQGNWGEVVLERVLEESGLRKGHEYETQFTAQDEDGKRRRPDVIVRLPDQKDIIIDAKCSLVDYERYCSAETDEERRTALRAHVAAVRSHVTGLSAKAYADLPGVRTLDFVLIFIPIEAAFLAAFEHEPALFRECYDRNIIIVSPTTLLATLRTVETIWRYERQNANAEQIAREAGRLHDQFALVLESLQDVGKQLERASTAYEKTLDRFSRGRGNLVRRVDNLARLGAKTARTLPPELVETADGEPAGEALAAPDEL
jgi:DNA recombination protein RmuC